MLCLRCVVHAHLLLDMVQTGTMYWLSSVLPYVLFIIPLVPKLLYRSTRIISLSLVPKLLYRSTRIISLSVSEWLYNIDGGIETLRSRWHWYCTSCQFFITAPDIFRSTSSFLDTLFALDYNILTYESNEEDAPALRARRGILLWVSWRSRLTIGDVVGAALVVLTLASKYYTCAC